MVDRVFVHIGLPKTATSYLQTLVWAHRPELAAEGLVVPGAERRDHLWSSRVVREDPHLAGAPERHRTSWARVREELAASDGTGLLSHEFFAAAGAEQARAMVEQLHPAEVHVVVTAREPLGLFTASWQESLKNGSTTPIEDYGRRVSASPTAIWNWRTLDLALVLGRWAEAVPPERTHVLVLDPSAERSDVWHRFAGLLGVPPGCVDLSAAFPNTSMGVAQAETLRRVNGELVDFRAGFDKGVYLRTFLADERLVPQGGEKFWPGEDQVADCRARARSAVELLAARPYDVSGRLEDLLVPDELEPRRTVDTVTDAEVAQVATRLVATMLGDVRRLDTERRRLRRAGPDDQGGADQGAGDGTGPVSRVRRAVARRRRG